MAHVACESKLLPVVMSFMHPCPGNWVAIGRAVMYYVMDAQIMCTGIKCRHCTWIVNLLLEVLKEYLPPRLGNNI